MKKLIVVRNGFYDDTLNLSDRGREQMLDLAPEINSIIGDGAAFILSSTAPKAEQSAQVLRSLRG